MIYDNIIKENSITLDEELKNPNALLECFVIDEVSRMNDADRKAFLESENAEFLVTEGIIGKRTIMKLSKQDELFRRKKVAALQIAREKGDKLYDKVLKFRGLEKQAFALIMKKYGMQAERVAKISQKEYLKKIPIGSKQTLTSKAMQTKQGLFGGQDRTSVSSPTK